MQSKTFWVFRKFVLEIHFFFKKLKYKYSQKVDSRKSTTSFSTLVFRAFFSQTIKNLFLACILFLGDSSLIPFIADRLLKIDIITLNSEIGTNIILGGMGIAGIILGLYCSNITSIYSAKYANAPTNLALLFQRDIITNRCVQQIVGYIILCVIVLGEFILQINVSYITMVVVLIMTIRMVIIFSITGSRSNQLSNTYQISENIYPEIISALKRVSSSHFYANDKNFQNYFQKICTHKLKDLKDISFFNKDNPSNQNASTVLFMSNNIILLGTYWNIKKKIRYDSLWYREKVQYKQWHFAPDSSIDIAMKTGTTLQPTVARNYWWMEHDIEEINEICFEKLCRDMDFEAILRYINNITLLSAYVINSGDIVFCIHSIEKLQNKFTPYCFDKKLTEDNNQMIAAICDAFVDVFINMIVGINSYLKLLDIQVILDDVAKLSSLKDADITTNALYNNRDTDDIFHRISVEIKLEGKRITPDWYIKQVASKYVIRLFNEILNGISMLCDGVIKNGKVFLDKKQHFQAAVIFSHSLEFISKSELTISIIEQYLIVLNKQRIDPKIIWEDANLEPAKQKIENTKKRLPQYLVKCSGAFALTHWTKREDYPDLLGFCYNHICEALVASIEKNDFETFKGTYPEFFSTMLLYQEYVRTDVIKIKEPHHQQAVFHVATAPIIEYAMISGLAMLWGEFNASSQWGELVKNELHNFIEKSPDNTAILTRLTEFASARKHDMHGIGNRDVLQTGWSIRISNAIRNSDLCKYEYGKFGQKILRTDSKLLKSFCGSSFIDLGFIHNVEDVYFVCCANQYLPQESRYIGDFQWGDDTDED